MDLLQILNFLKNSKFGLPSPAAARLLVFSITVVVNLLVFKPAAELERCQWDRPNPAVLIDVQKIFSKKKYIYTSICFKFLLISRVLKVLTLIICCQSLCCFHEEYFLHSLSLPFWKSSFSLSFLLSSEIQYILYDKTDHFHNCIG